MKRVLLTILVFLLLGAVVNVGVAWGCAALLDPREGSVGWPEGEPRPRLAIAKIRQGPTYIALFEWHHVRSGGSGSLKSAVLAALHEHSGDDLTHDDVTLVAMEIR